MFCFNGKSLQGISINYKTIKIINPNGSDSQWVLQHQRSSCWPGKLRPGPCRWAGRNGGKGQAQGLPIGGLLQESKAGCSPHSMVSPGAQEIPGQRLPIGFKVSLFLFHRKSHSHSFMHLNIYWATTVWHALYLAWRKQTPCPCGVYILV